MAGHALRRVMSSAAKASSAAAAPLIARTLSADGVAHLALASPPVNTLSRELLRQLRKHLDDAATDTTVRGVILSSKCRAFSAGLDITEFVRPTRDRFTEYLGDVSGLFRALYLHPKPVVAAIVGAAPAGGCWMALQCDYRVLLDAPGVVMGLNETQLGERCPRSGDTRPRTLRTPCSIPRVLAGIFAPQTFWVPMAVAVGQRAAERLLQLGSLVPPSEALRLGMVDETAPSVDAVEAAAVAALRKYLAVPSASAVSATKLAMRGATAKEALAVEAAESEALFARVASAEVQAGLTAYMASLRSRK